LQKTFANWSISVSQKGIWNLQPVSAVLMVLFWLNAVSQALLESLSPVMIRAKKNKCTENEKANTSMRSFKKHI